MQTDIQDSMHMMLEEKMAKLLVKIDLNLYQEYVLTNHRKPVMYVQLKKVMYGTLHAMLLLF
jgi:hypothetical protein